jgi:hypothetical protein
VFYDDTASLLDKISLYRNRGVQAISFWRIGQGPSDIWPRLAVAAPVQENRPIPDEDDTHTAANTAEDPGDYPSPRTSETHTGVKPARTGSTLTGVKESSALVN